MATTLDAIDASNICFMLSFYSQYTITLFNFSDLLVQVIKKNIAYTVDKCILSLTLATVWGGRWFSVTLYTKSSILQFVEKKNNKDKLKPQHSYISKYKTTLHY